jgi:dUTPase
MEVKVFKLKEIKLLSGDVVDVEQYCNVQPILPTYGKEDDACMDVYPILCEHDVDKDRFIYHTGLAFNIGNDANGEPNEMSLRPRSNLTKSDFYMPNAPGTLDYKNY